MDRPLANFAEQVPQSQVHAENDVEDDALTPVVERGVEHLVPDLVNVRHPGAFDEASRVLLDDKRAQLTSGCNGKSHRAIAGLHLYHQRLQYVDTNAAAPLPVFWVLRHGRGDMVVDPVGIALVMIIRPAAPEGKRTGVFNGGHAYGRLLAAYRRKQRA